MGLGEVYAVGSQHLGRLCASVRQRLGRGMGIYLLGGSNDSAPGTRTR